MRRLIYYSTVSLDGYFSGEDGSLDAFLPSDEEHQYANDLVAGADAFIFGRVMYELMAYWDSEEATGPEASAVEREFATIYRSKPRHVFSRTLTSLDDERATLVRDDIAGHVTRLKAEDGGYLGLGCGPELLAFFLEQRLVDEVRLLVLPIALGRGVSLFGALTEPRSFRLTSSATTARGGLLLTYEPA
ncbi:MAG: dihydrofolate reductase family protein [Dehalococcoidia bacterium]|nr:dihydrofolate reductase family protein [Dehalococcoidia bacterium]